MILTFYKYGTGLLSNLSTSNKHQIFDLFFMFIMLDGIDGCGKSTIIQAWKDYLTTQGNAIFDLKKYWQETGRYPEFSELKNYTFIFSCEPTYVGIGNVIRQELVKNGNNYPAKATAEAFSLDRLILYTKLIIPLIKNGCCVIQDRGVSSSLAYQTTQNPELTLKFLSSLTGNKLALTYRPDYLVLLDLKPEEAIKRLGKRTNKKDDAIFEKLSFLKKLYKQYHSSAFKKIFTKHGSKINLLPTNVKIDIMKQQAVDLLKTILN